MSIYFSTECNAAFRKGWKGQSIIFLFYPFPNAHTLLRSNLYTLYKLGKSQDSQDTTPPRSKSDSGNWQLTLKILKKANKIYFLCIFHSFQSKKKMVKLI